MLQHGTGFGERVVVRCCSNIAKNLSKQAGF